MRDQDFPTVCEMAGLDCAYLRKKIGTVLRAYADLRWRSGATAGFF
jgi:hypothetical protein